ncbi:MAG TPA: hypothetical protein VKI44_33135 [Acetobacteraceae bacterium]|nr:hypothetical protein [Acetobacteraceae bacterium]
MLVWAALPVLSILGFAFALREALRLPLALTLLPASAVVVLILLAGSLAGLLHEAGFLALLTGLTLLIWRGFPVLRDGGWRDPAFAAFLAVALGLYLYLRPLELIFWDEFSHWGTFTKFLLLTDRLPRVLGEVIFIAYPPGLGLFSYFITRGFGFDEGFLLFGSGLLQAVALISFLAAFRWRDLPSCAVLAAALIVAGSIFGTMGYNWTTVSADNSLATIAGAALVTYLAGGRGRGAVVATGLIMALTCSVKDSGNLLASVIGIAVLLDQLLMRRQEGVGLDAGSLLRLLVALVLPSAGMILAWRLHLAILGQRDVMRAGPDVILTRLAEPGFQDYAVSIARDYLVALWGGRAIGNLPITLPIWLTSLGLLALNGILLQSRRRLAANVTLMHGVLAAGFLVYAASLLFFYVFVFGPYEARHLAGMERYVSTYLFMWLLASLAIVIWDRSDRASHLSLAAWAGIGLFVSGPAFWSAVSAGPRGDAFAAEVLRSRNEVRKALAGSLAKIPKEVRVYVLWNGTPGLPFYISEYELKPRYTSIPGGFGLRPEQWCHSLGPRRFADDIWSCDWTLATFVAALQDYDFLFVNAADEAFITRYGSLFPEGTLQAGHTMFRIRHDGSAVRMEPL